MHYPSALSLAALVLTACIEQESSPVVAPQPAPAEVEKKPACCEEMEAGGVLPDLSIYQLESKWTSQEGKSIGLAHFRGRPVVLAMIFTWCEYACPRTLADLREIESKLPVADRARTRFVLVSFDSEKDRPPALKRYATDNDLDLTRWTLLHGAAGDVRELAAVLGVKYKRSATVGFSHSNLITVLDAEGRVAHRQKGIGASSGATLDAIARTD